MLFLQHTIDEVENLIKKHEAFEKSAAAQEERFSALHRLTTVSSGIHVHTHAHILRDNIIIKKPENASQNYYFKIKIILKFYN